LKEEEVVPVYFSFSNCPINYWIDGLFLVFFLVVVVSVLCVQVRWVVVFWVLFFVWVVVLGLFGCCWRNLNFFMLLVVDWQDVVQRVSEIVDFC